jgi:hypothetical protein
MAIQTWIHGSEIRIKRDKIQSADTKFTRLARTWKRTDKEQYEDATNF